MYSPFRSNLGLLCEYVLSKAQYQEVNNRDEVELFTKNFTRSENFRTTQNS